MRVQLKVLECKKEDDLEETRQALERALRASPTLAAGVAVGQDKPSTLGVFNCVAGDETPPNVDVEGGSVTVSKTLEPVNPVDQDYWADLPKGGSDGTDPFCAYVFIDVVEGKEDEFVAASINNAANSRAESGVLKFDLLRDVQNPRHFVLREIYKDAVEAPKKHKETAHYAQWRDTVADMMANPRSAAKFVLH
mmetsp:Transcript_2942/g.9007  ORF Transcript_2942/g.9007 Transcript_2942/m.9007 type:complete len:194 (-) Transcript_2942:39-620(-)